MTAREASRARPEYYMPRYNDVYRTATLFLLEHGDDATAMAGRHADECLEKGDIDGERIWLRVIRTIEGLRAQEPPSGAAVH